MCVRVSECVCVCVFVSICACVFVSICACVFVSVYTAWLARLLSHALGFEPPRLSQMRYRLSYSAGPSVSV